MKKKYQIGIIGWGTVGVGVSKILMQNTNLIWERSGIEFQLKYIADLDLERNRDVSVPKEILTNDAQVVLDDEEIDIVIELIGGYQPALDFIKKALTKGKKVVTANKALLARHGRELFQLAKENKTELRFEASVAGGIPIVKSLTEGFIANHITAIYGIVNGTANFILTQMQLNKSEFEKTVKNAQDLGYAETDPSFDINGNDSAHKLAILASLAYGKWIHEDDLYTEGISQITGFDIKEADQFGYVIKLLAISKLVNDKIQVRVHPTFISKKSPLASIEGAYNAVYVEGDFLGQSLQYGLGAGEKATASAVMADVVDVALSRGSLGLIFNDKYNYALESMDDLVCKHYLRIDAEDASGVLAEITGILGAERISIASIDQSINESVSGHIPVVIMTHETKESQIKLAQQKIDVLEHTGDKSLRIRVEEF